MATIFIDIHDLESAVTVREAVQEDGHDVQMIESADEVESRLGGDDEDVALILTGDLERSGVRAMVGVFSSRIPRPPVLAVAGLDEPEERHEVADRLGLDECIPAPPSEDEVRVVVDQQLDRYRLQLETGIVGRTEPMREVLERISLIAPVRSTVLLTGESGTGKELAARAIHRLSPRRGKSFIAVNCAALPESLLESELFGHEKGAFTGATSRRKGMFELADGGTLLLDEISEMPPPLQTRLLRVLETRRFMRVGGEEEIDVNVRVIAATNRDLKDAVRKGEFRRDLYYRLNVLHMELPPLRERREDIPLLVRRFVGEFSEAHEREFKGISAEAMDLLMAYAWPGNVRELRNLVESMVVLAPGSVIRPDDIPPEIRSGEGRAMLPTRREASEAVPVSGVRSADERLPELEYVFRTLVELKMDIEDLRREFDRYREAHPELVEGEGRRRRGTEIEIAALDEMLDERARGEVPSRPGSQPAGGARGEERATGGAPAGAEAGAGVEGEEAAAAAAAAGDGRAGRPSGKSPGAESESGPETEPGKGVETEFGDEGAVGEGVITFEPGMTMKELEREAIVATLRDVGGNRRQAAERLGIGERTLYRKLKEYDIDL